MADSFRCCGLVLEKEDGRVLRRASDFVVEGQGKKVRPKKTWRKLIEEEGMMVDLSREEDMEEADRGRRHDG